MKEGREGSRDRLTGLTSTSHWLAELMTTLGSDSRSPPLTPCVQTTRHTNQDERGEEGREGREGERGERQGEREEELGDRENLMKLSCTVEQTCGSHTHMHTNTQGYEGIDGTAHLLTRTQAHAHIRQGIYT